MSLQIFLKNQISLYLLILICLTVCSCSRIKNKGQEVTHKIERKVMKVTKYIVNEVFPMYDAHSADTKYNKQRFVDNLKIELTPDVKEIYCDFPLGIDYKVLIAFTCDSSTIQRIISEKKLALSKEEDIGLNFGEEFAWWDKEKLHRIRPYIQGEENKYWHYLWYDKEHQKAYYLFYTL